MCGTLLQDRERHGCRARAHTDVLVASPEGRYRATSAPILIKSIGACVAPAALTWLTDRKQTFRFVPTVKYCEWYLDTPKHNTGVGATEAEIVAHHRVHNSVFPGFQQHRHALGLRIQC